jgi:hypothetical protein
MARISVRFLNIRRFAKFPFLQIGSKRCCEARFAWISLDLFTHEDLNLS